jgi:cytochrome c556
LINNQFSPSAVTARLAWVRGRTRASPAHAKRHVGQRQFHCGKPPPAAEPRTRAVNRPIQDRRECAESELGRQISVDLEADADLNEARGCPRHWSPSVKFSKQEQSSARQARAQAPAYTGASRPPSLKARPKEKPDPCGSGCSLSARGPTITFQRGTADGATIAIWEDGQPPAASDAQYAAAILSHNAKACMPAMRPPVGPDSGSLLPRRSARVA